MKYLKIILFLIILSLLSGCLFKKDNKITNTNMPEETKKVRPMAVNGSFYPDAQDELRQMVDSYLGAKTAKNEQIRAVVAPHAGYEYSGKVAGGAFGYLKGQSYKTVMVMGPSHYASFSGVSMPKVTHYQTPLGEVKLSKISSELLKEKYFQTNNAVHQREHAIEVELPFLQEALGDFELVPMIFGNQTSLAELKEIALTLKNYLDDETLVVVSCDFTHYGPNYNYVPFTENSQARIKEIDEQVINYLFKHQTEELYSYLQTTALTNDGSQVLIILSELLKDLDIQGERVAYDTSGRITGDIANSVSYVGLLFSGESLKTALLARQLNEREKDYLLKLARQTLKHYYDTGEVFQFDKSEVPERLLAVQGAFVTLEKNKQLRGCIGYIEPINELYQAVVDNVIAAALHDSRFTPVTKDELIDIKIEISVLSVPKERQEISPGSRHRELRPLIDGVVLKQGNRTSTYLPQVWEELSDPIQFLTSLCQKGGMHGNCWKDEEVKMYTYQAEVFGE